MSEVEQPIWRMPAEWNPHHGTWVSWPHNQETWPKNLDGAREEFRALITAIAAHEFVYVCLNDDEMSARFTDWLVSDVTPGRIILVHVPTNDAWARDYAPTFVLSSSNAGGPRRPAPPWFPVANEQLGAVNWHYNAWGGKYPPFDLDQQVARRIAEETGATLIDSTLCLEGGAIEVNDEGVLLTTRSCVLNPNRNPDLSFAQVEAELKLRLGVDQIIWLPGDAILGDDTDGHIDQLARFVNNRTILYAWTDDQSDPQQENLRANLEALQAGLSDLNLDYELQPLPLPAGPVFRGPQRLPASYCNFLITNGSVIVPQFGDRNDELALSILDQYFPEREMVGLASNHLSVGLGSFHCLTQQMPDVN
jgi:agmatine deiminase